MMKRLLILIIAIISLSGVMVQAQDPEDACDMDALRSEFIREIEEATTLDELNAAHTLLGARLTHCRLHADPDSLPEFSGSGDEIVGPIEIERGYYEIKYTSAKVDGIARLELDFQHESDHFRTLQLNSYGIHGRELTELAGGTYFINVESNDTWGFSILPFDPTVMTDVMVLSSDSDDDYLGPFELEAGFYLLEYEGEIDPDHPWSGGHFYAQIRTASDLDNQGGVSETTDEDFSANDIFHLEAGVYVITAKQDGLRSWSVKLSPAN
jgi:hypothetical protein